MCRTLVGPGPQGEEMEPPPTRRLLSSRLLLRLFLRDPYENLLLGVSDTSSTADLLLLLLLHEAASSYARFLFLIFLDLLLLLPSYFYTHLLLSHHATTECCQMKAAGKGHRQRPIIDKRRQYLALVLSSLCATTRVMADRESKVFLLSGLWEPCCLRRQPSDHHPSIELWSICCCCHCCHWWLNRNCLRQGWNRMR